jgi:hypothetical protein
MTEPIPLQQRVALAIHRYDNHHALSGNDIPSDHHRGEAAAALAELKPELERLAEYEHTINWMTTCTGCARVLDSAYAETMRAEKAEAALARVEAKVAEWRDWNPAEMSWAIRDIENAIANTPPPQPEDPAALAEPKEQQ